MKRTFRIILFAGSLLLALAITACGGSPAASPGAGDWAAFVPDTNAYVALSSDGQRLLAYACDGDGNHPLTFAVWIQGAATNQAVNLTAKSGAHLTAILNAQSATGTLTLSDGKVISFTANAVPAQGSAGLYGNQQTFNGVLYQGGWIVVPNRAEIGGGILNTQTGALIASPAPDLAGKQVTVPNVGIFYPVGPVRGYPTGPIRDFPTGPIRN